MKNYNKKLIYYKKITFPDLNFIDYDKQNELYLVVILLLLRTI